MAKIIPSNYKKFKGILKLKVIHEKLIETIAMNFSEQEAIILANVTSFPYDGNSFILCVLFKNKGVLFVKDLEISDESNIEDTLKFYQDSVCESISKRIISKLGSHRQLQMQIGESVYPKFPVKTVFFSANLKRKSILSTKINDFVDKNLLFEEDLDSENNLILMNVISEHYISANADFTELEIDDFVALIQQISPEYTIPRYICSKAEPEVGKKINEDFELGPIKIEGQENFVKAWQLDEEQIELVNSLLYKHELILACAGSGKSVLLLSRAIKIAKLYPDRKILITFFNTALRTFYKWRLSVAGVNLNNVVCSNFHQLCRNLLDKNRLSLPTSTGGDFFNDLVDLTREGIDNKGIEDKYFAIFIDEVQDFDSEWYKICVDLLEEKNDNYILCLCGDITQDINGMIKNGVAPWQGEGLFSFRGRARRLSKNYRNTKEINEYSTKFADLCLDWMFDNIDNKEIHNEDFMYGTSERSVGYVPSVVMSENNNEAIIVADKLEEYHNQYKVPYSDMAVIFPYMSFRPIKYSIQYWLSKTLEERGISYSLVTTPDDSISFYNYATRRGVTLSTMGKVKGLDYTAVIICGLKPFTYHNQLTESQILRNMKKVYTSITRAMNYLDVVITNKAENDVITKFLLESKSN